MPILICESDIKKVGEKIKKHSLERRTFEKVFILSDFLHSQHQEDFIRDLNYLKVCFPRYKIEIITSFNDGVDNSLDYFMYSDEELTDTYVNKILTIRGPSKEELMEQKNYFEVIERIFLDVLLNNDKQVLESLNCIILGFPIFATDYEYWTDIITNIYSLKALTYFKKCNDFIETCFEKIADKTKINNPEVYTYDPFFLLPKDNEIASLSNSHMLTLKTLYNENTTFI